jgi:D-alanyl-D-alanine carboxypeptidase
MGIRPRDRFTLRDLLCGLIQTSGNDAALAVARHLQPPTPNLQPPTSNL